MTGQPARRTRATDLRSPLQRTVQRLAEDLLGRAPEAKLPTTLEYQRLAGVGSGTVQRALSTIEGSGAVSLSRHGHRGTRIVKMRPGLLWSLGGRGQVRIVVPIPGAIDVFGLSKGLRAEFDRLDIPSDLGYLAGSSARARGVVASHADVAVMSRSAADQVPKSIIKAVHVIQLGDGSFYGPDSLVVLQRAGDPRPVDRPLRIGRIHASTDHVQLTAAEFPETDRITYIDLPYMSLPSAILQDQVDVGVWHRALMPAPLEILGLAERPLSNPKIAVVLEEMSSAALVVRSSDSAIRRLFNQIDLLAVEQVQKELETLDSTAPESLEQMWSR